MPWAECEVTRAGPAENGVIYVALRKIDNSFHHWFQAVPGMKKEILATALTAISTGHRVTALLSDTVAYSELQRLYVRG